MDNEQQIGEIPREKRTDIGEITTISSIVSQLYKPKVYFLLNYFKFISCLEKALINNTIRNILVLELSLPFPSCVTLGISHKPSKP